MPGETVSLLKYIEDLREADQRALLIERENTKDRLESHNGLIRKMDADRDLFASKDTVNALKEAFDIYKEITAKALALAEGKSKGVDAVRAAVTFVLGCIVAGLGVYAATKGLR
jgi:hypothetical protein